MSTAACVPVAGNRIEGRDLATADSRFGELPANVTIGFAPAPGTKRVFSVAELLRIAKSNGISVAGAAEVCFEIPVAPLTIEHAMEAMRPSLPAGATVKIIELQNISIPVAGTLEFPVVGLEPASPISKDVQLWRGHVKYAESRQMAVWARVKASAEYRDVVAIRDLPAGAQIVSAALRLAKRTGPLEHERLANRIEDVTGRVPKRAIKAGSSILVSDLAEAPAVKRGDAVNVEVQSGLARLHFEAIAQSEAHTGEMVDLRNPTNGKIFRARLDGEQRASIVIRGRQ